MSKTGPQAGIGPGEIPDPKSRILDSITGRLANLRDQVGAHPGAEEAIQSLQQSLAEPSVNVETLRSVEENLKRTIDAFTQGENPEDLKAAIEGIQRLVSEGAAGVRDPKVQEFLKKLPGGEKLAPFLEKMEGYIESYPSFLNAGKFKEWSANADSALWKLILSYLKTLPQSELNFLQVELTQYGKTLKAGTRQEDVRSALNKQVPAGKIKERKAKQDPTYDFVEHLQQTMVVMDEQHPEKNELEVDDFVAAGKKVLEDYKPVPPAPEQAQTTETAGGAQEQKSKIEQNMNAILASESGNIQVGMIKVDNLNTLELKKDNVAKKIRITNQSITSLYAVRASNNGPLDTIEIAFADAGVSPIRINTEQLVRVFEATAAPQRLKGTQNQDVTIEILADATD